MGGEIVKNRFVLPMVYGVLFVMALLWMFAHARQTAFCGIFVVLLTFPWSLVLTPVIDAISPGVFDSSMLPGTILAVVSALLNAGILFVIGGVADGRWRGKRS